MKQRGGKIFIEMEDINVTDEEVLIKYYGGKAQYNCGKLYKIGERRVDWCGNRIIRVGSDRVDYCCGKRDHVGGNLVKRNCGEIVYIGQVKIK